MIYGNPLRNCKLGTVMLNDVSTQLSE